MDKTINTSSQDVIISSNYSRRVMLFYPPSKLYQRGEDRSQGNIENATATSMRACNDLGYAASTLKTNNYEILLKDYQTEQLGLDQLLDDYRDFAPDIIFLSVTNSTIFGDLKIVSELKDINRNLTVILKGALFFDPEDSMMNQLDLADVDYLIGGESDFVLSELVNWHFTDRSRISSIPGILYRDLDEWRKTDFTTWNAKLDELPYPDRTLMNNALYIRPDTGEPMATISTSRGCPASCIYCLTPTISGKEVRLRSPENIFSELLECYSEHNIRNFFFKSDTFTINREWVVELCDYIIDSELNGKIEWVANSRVRPLEKETLEAMKRAGCWLIAFGFESGSRETLKKIRKGVSLEDNLVAGRYAKEVGLKIFGFFLIGLPWEDHRNLEETKKMVFEIQPDFMEVHIATPYYGTELYEIAQKNGLIDSSVLGKDYFNAPTLGTKYLSLIEIQRFKKGLLLSYHLRPGYILRKLIDGLRRPKVLVNYVRFGLSLVKDNLRGYPIND